nr:hypothetical protein [Paracoccus ravus]
MAAACGASRAAPQISAGEVERLNAKIGQNVIERDFLSAASIHILGTGGKKLVKQDHLDLSVRRQCRLLSLARSGLYYQPRGEIAETLKLMEIIDRPFLEMPWVMAPARWPGKYSPRASLRTAPGPSADEAHAPGADLSGAKDQQEAPGAQV